MAQAPRSGGSGGGRRPARPGRPAAKPGAKPGSRAGGKPAAKSVAKPGAKPGGKPRTGGKPGERSGGKPGSRPSGTAGGRVGPRGGDRPRDEGRIRDPHLDDTVVASDLDPAALNELRTLPEGLGELVARHLVAAESALIDEETDVAIAHIEAAVRKAGRVAVVREAAAITYYRAGQYAKALAELRTVKRMTGSPAFSPLIADCERGLGRPQKALDYLRTIDIKKAEPTIKVELLIVAAGARADLGQVDAAIITLQGPELTRLPPGTPRARLQYAYADLLLRAGRRDEGVEWMERAAASDIDEETDAAARCEELERGL